MAKIDARAAARTAYSEGDWDRTYSLLSAADAKSSLGPEDLERYSVAATMLGRDEDFIRILERAHQAYLEAGATERAVRCAFWIGMTLILRGEVSQGSGWLSRAQRLLDHHAEDCVEKGYLLLPTVERLLAGGEYDRAFELSAQAVDAALRFGDQELLALALHTQGKIRLRQARTSEALTFFDEAMATISSTSLFPPVTGIVYCALIAACRSVYDFERAHEWTRALSEWCSRQNGLVAFAGQCLVHRSELLQLRGDWEQSLLEAHSAWERCSRAERAMQQTAGAAFYQRAELLRLKGDLEEAERWYLEALRQGRDPQPGMAQLRLAQGNLEAAKSAISRALLQTQNALARARLLPALVEIAVECGDVDDAAAGSRELEETAERFGTRALGVLSARVRGVLALAQDAPDEAVSLLRQAAIGWQELGAPYEVAKVRLLLGSACLQLGDTEGARLELETARGTFTELGAEPDVGLADKLLAALEGRHDHGLTARELQVLRLVARGHSNKHVAGELGVSERTVHRHVSNIFDKLGVSSRSAATSYAYEHSLV